MPLLREEPPARIDDLDVLLGIAMALEVEAVRRYAQLALMMDQRGDADTAATFRSLMAEEETHTDAVGRWAANLNRAAPDGGSFLWLLPPDIAASWDDLLDRTRLTPYQALSLAVVNEQRAFTFYSHIAAGTEDEAVRASAEALAREELGHAALLRRERRRVYHRDNAGRARPEQPSTPAALDRLVRDLLGGAAVEHAALSRRLGASGDAAGSALLAAIAQEEAAIAGQDHGAGPAIDDTGESGEPWPTAVVIVERLAERFSDIAATAADETVLSRALALQESSIRHLARLANRQA